jgi:glutathione S-transferase
VNEETAEPANEETAEPANERIYHLALVRDLEAARAAGDYRVSSLGMTLAQEGFIHASRADQWEGVRQRFYSGVTEPLVLLVINPDLLTAPLVVEEAPGTGEAFPHIYGPLNLGAVVETRRVDQ